MIANPALVASLLVTAGAVLSAAPGFVPSDAALAQSLDARQSLAIEGPTTVEFPENSTAAIATYRVANAASESTISWSIDGTDARRLSIDGSGVIRFGVAKNFERPNDGNRDNEYEIELSAAVGSTQVSVEVIIRVTDVNEPPAFELESVEFSVEENASGNRRVGGALVASDPDEGDSRTFSVEGEDADLFHIDDEGQIRVRPGALLDYETLGILSFTALVTDQGGLSDSLPVQIGLTDADDPGIVTFLSGRPFIGMPFTATISDQDGVTGRIRWRWHRAGGTSDEFIRIDGATGSSYTPAEDDEGYILRATVSYEDNFEVGASASEISAAVGRNAVPEFESASITLTVPEEAPAGTDVGDPVSATDSDGDDLSYTLSGADASYFGISALTGQISVGAQALPDSETKDSYSLIVTATDEAGAKGSVTVLITVAPPDVKPSIIGPATASFTENGTGVVATYSVADLDDDNVTLSVAGTDETRFSISDSGELSFNSAPDYENPQDANNDNVYAVTVTASDGDLTVELDVEVTVTNVNEAASITGPATVNYSENGTENVTTYSATDSEGDEITWDVAGTDAALFGISVSGELTFDSSPDHENPNDANTDNVYEVTVTASDGILESTLDVGVTVTDVNEAAVIAGPTSVSYEENGTASVATYTATDPEGDEVTLDIAGGDVAQFALNLGGELSFNSPPDYDETHDANNDNVYEVTVTASDGQLESTLDVKVTVTDFAEAILITGSATVDYAENGTATVATYMAADPNRDGITWDIAGADAVRFAISVTGGLSFNSPPDYEKPRDGNKNNVYEVTVVASDDNLESTLDVEVTVKNVNEAILITGPASFSYVENSTTSLAIYTAADPDGDEITWGVAGADVSRFSIKETGELSFNSPPDYEKPRDANKDNVFQVTVTASDGNLTAELDVEVTVTDVNEAASITGPATVSHTENTVENLATYSATDPEGDEITWGIAGTDMSRFSIKETGELSFNSPPDFENPWDANSDNVYELMVKASNGNLESTLDIEITVTNVDESPVVTGLATVSYVENGTASVATYAATDPEGDEVTWDIVGTDVSRFSIKETGELSFNSPPDHEKPRDTNSDNVYEMTVTASDGRLESTLDVEVTVTNVAEPATITGPITVSYEENGKGLVATYTLVDSEGDGDSPTVFLIEGIDAAHFVIDIQGALAFIAPPNFESPADADANNFYAIQVVANDEGSESSLNVVVEVTDANDAPRFPSRAIVTEIPENSCPGAYSIYRGIGGDSGIEADEDGDPLTYALSGPDERTFVIHPPTGYVTLGPGTLLDFETSRKPFTLRVFVSDGRDDLGNTENDFNADDYLDLTVVVSDVDEPPVFSEAQLILDACGSPVGYGSGQLRREVTAGVRAGSPVGAALSVLDSEGESVRFRIVSQSDPGAFIVESSTGQILVAPDFSPRDARRVYTLRVAAMKGGMESQVEVRIAVVRASRPTPEPDIETSPTPEPETVHTPNDEVPLAPRATEDRSDSLQGDGLAVKTEDDVVGPGLTSARLARVEPVFVPVPRAAQTLFIGKAEVQDRTGHARLTTPAGTLAVPYQVRLTQNEAACVSPNVTAPPQDCVCVSVEFFDVGGAPLEKESLNRPALLEIVLRTQDEAENTEIEKERAEIGRDSVEVMMRQDDEHEWAYIRGDLRRPADGSSILMIRVRAPGQYMALVTESGTERKAPVSAIPLNLVKTAVTQQAQTTVTKSVAERSAAFFYEPVVVHTQPQPAPFVSAEPQPWQTMRLLIALLLDVTVALSAGILLQRFTFRRH